MPSYMFDEKGQLVPTSGNVPSNVIEKELTLLQDLGGAKAGQKVMMAVTPSDTAQVTELETYLGGYSQGGFGADLLSPIVQVDKETSKRHTSRAHVRNCSRALMNLRSSRSDCAFSDAETHSAFSSARATAGAN